jgi:hypothetical protein
MIKSDEKWIRDYDKANLQVERLKRKIISDICLNNAIGPCKYVMDQTFRDSEGKYWTEEYCVLTGWRLFGSGCKDDCRRESCTRYEVQTSRGGR